MPRQNSDEIEVTGILESAMENGASDIHFKVGYEPILRCKGHFEYLDMDKLTKEQLHQVAKSILPERKLAELSEGDVDTSFEFKDEDNKMHRYRVNAAHDRSGDFIAIRAVPDEIIPLEDIGFPYKQVWQRITTLKEGLVLVTGRTGSGKSTTLASLIQRINQERAEHIITIEDPVEYVYEPVKSIISQREIGVSVRSFAEGIRSALREDPDVIQLQEIRDLDTAYHALEAASTGHLVFATLHTVSAVDTVRRYVNMFDKADHDNIRHSLASNLAYVLSQNLIPYHRDVGKSLAMEIMNVRDCDGIKNLLREGKDSQLLSQIQTQHKLGMITMDQHLALLAKQGTVDTNEAILYAHREKDFLESYQSNIK